MNPKATTKEKWLEFATQLWSDPEIALSVYKWFESRGFKDDMTHPSHNRESWDFDKKFPNFEGTYGSESIMTQRITAEEMKSFIDHLLSQTREDTLKEVEKQFNEIHFLNHYDEGNDTYWEKEKGNHLVMSMHISDYDKFRSALTTLSEKIKGMK